MCTWYRSWVHAGVIGSFFVLCWGAGAHAQSDPSVEGQWGSLLSGWPAHGRHAVLLKDGKVLIARGPSDVFLFDPATETVSVALPGPPTEHDLGCSGHSALPDGRIFFAGGHPGSEARTPLNTIFNPDGVDTTSWPNVTCNNCWVSADDSSVRRWYPTCTTLADGRILTLAGWRSEAWGQCAGGLCTTGPFVGQSCTSDLDCSDNLANRPMIFDATQSPGQQWTELVNAEYCPKPGAPCPPGLNYDFHIPTYPFHVSAFGCSRFPRRRR